MDLLAAGPGVDKLDETFGGVAGSVEEVMP